MSRRTPTRMTVELFPFLAVLVCVMGALIFLLLVMTRQLRASAVARAQTIVQTLQDERPAPILPEFADEHEVGPEADDERQPSPQPEPEPVPATEPVKPAPPVIDYAAIEAERAALRQKWQTTVDGLQQDVDTRQTALQRQQLLVRTIERQIAAAQQDLLQREAELAELMGRSSVAEDRAQATGQERTRLEQQILALRQHLKQLADQQRDASSRYSVVPFDGKSGTTRKPLLIECRSTGIRFLPEDVTLSPQDFDGFTPGFNPLSAGLSALMEFWSRAENQTEGEPYPMLIVRPDGTLAYYMAMKLLSGSRSTFGYELVTDEVALQLPPVNPEAKAVLEAAVQRVMQERAAIMGPPGNGLTGNGPTGTGGGGRGNGVRGGTNGGSLTPGGGRGFPPGSTGIFPADTPRSRTLSGGASPGSAPGTSAGLNAGSAVQNADMQEVSRSQAFEMSDLERENGVGERSWESLDRFGGQEFRRNRGGPGNNSATASRGPGNGEGSPVPGSTRAATTARPPERLPAGNSTQQPDSGTAAGPRQHSSGSNSTSANSPDASSASRSDSDQTSSSSSSSSSSQELSAAEQQQYPNFNADLGRKQGRQKELPYDQLRHRRWGPHEPGASIGVEKTVEIRVDAEQMIIDNDFVIRVPAGASRNDVFHQLINSLDQVANTWGQPGKGFFWVPRLKFVISPGGNSVYERVAPLVTKSGLSNSTEFTLDQARQTVRETQP